jgi:hypothetical protein
LNLVSVDRKYTTDRLREEWFSPNFSPMAAASRQHKNPDIISSSHGRAGSI